MRRKGWNKRQSVSALKGSGEGSVGNKTSFFCNVVWLSRLGLISFVCVSLGATVDELHPSIDLIRTFSTRISYLNTILGLFTGVKVRDFQCSYSRTSKCIYRARGPADRNGRLEGYS